MSIDNRQIGRIYAMGNAAGIVERGSKEDDLHALVYQTTGKTSIRSLTAAEGRAVEAELKSRAGAQRRRTKSGSVPGMMTAAQKRLAWAIIYHLIQLDSKPDSASAAERMSGAVKKVLGVDAPVRDPLRWVDFTGGEKLIEQLKRYERSARRRASREGG